MIEFVANTQVKGQVSVDEFGLETAERVAAWHASFPEYAPTPLVDLQALAAELGVAGFYVKDESPRFGLNAFKVLGGSYALGRCIAERLGTPIDELPCEVITSPATQPQLGQLTFATATDGNHGRGVAWAAQRLGHKAVVRMPQGSADERLQNIRALGADAAIVPMKYDDVVRQVAADAQRNGWILVQDTTMPGYQTVPRWIMQGYITIGLEIVRQLGTTLPTHLFLQAGVGSMAGALAAFFASYYGERCPHIIVVEPVTADCFFATARANDGALHATEGDLNTIMAGLACGEPCDVAWDILHACAHGFVRMADWVAAEGMRVLAQPRGADKPIVSGESGASGVGLAIELMRGPRWAELREAMQLDANSTILCISTEGATDQADYRRIVEQGAYPRP